VEGFLSTIREKIDIFNANLHPVTHYESVDAKLTSIVLKVNNFIEQMAIACNKITGTFTKMNEAITEIEKRAQLSVPLLKSVEDALSQFREPIKKLCEEIKSLKSNKSYVEYQSAFNELMSNMQKDTSNKKGEKVKKMINLIMDVCINQLQLETMLDTPTKLCQIIKSKGKKGLADMKQETQAKILKYFFNIIIK
jgi:soluble cytochrome b562